MTFASRLQAFPKTLFHWITSQWFLVLCVSLLLFITFYPKIPLFDVIPGYIVRARLEDLFLMLVNFIFLIQLLRKKYTLDTPITAILIFYTVVGILSMLSAVFIVHSVPMVPLHISKMLLHFLRRMEYFSIFFLFYNAVKTQRQIKIVLFALVIMVFGISVYGYGQKYLYWPVYSTMNREFSKGMRLILTDHARVPSTFGGHYDMSAFDMFALTMILAMFFYARSKKYKVVLLVAYLMGFWLLILGSSRSSFLGYLLAVSLLVLFIGIQKASLKWAVSRGIAVIGFSMLIMVTFGDLSSRFTQLGVVQEANQRLEALMKSVKEKPKDAIEVNPVTETDQLPVPVATPTATTSAGTTPIAVGQATPIPNTALPPDVYVNVPNLETVTSTKSGVTTTTVIQVPREYSDCTYVYGLSACIRLETLWPRALNGLKRNPLVGSGYSTLTKATPGEFTEAESTDNDFFRNLGESGLLGAIGFYGPIGLFFIASLKSLKKKHTPVGYAVIFGIMAGSLGLFFNADYIDVFEASKVAYMYWSILAVGFAWLTMLPKISQTPVEEDLEKRSSVKRK